MHFAGEARRVLERNADHPGLRIASQELQRLLDRSQAVIAAGERPDAMAQQFARLAAHGITPVDVLGMVVAVGLFDQDQPNFLRSTDAYHLAVGRAVCGLLPRRLTRLNKRTSKQIGSRLVDQYAALVATVIKAIDKAEAASQQRAAAMSAPLVIPDSTSNNSNG
jgi:hypothetical protein